MTVISVTVITNAEAALQPSMIGYGKLVLSEVKSDDYELKEARSVSTAARLLNSKWSRKIGLNIDRFLLSPIKMLAVKSDIVHVIDPGNSIYLPFVRARAKIVTVHDMIPYLALSNDLAGFQPSRLGRLLMKHIVSRLKKADRIIVVSEQTREDLVRITGIAPEKITVIPNAMFQKIRPTTTSKTASIRARLAIPSEAPVIMHIGRNFYKNRTAVLSVFESVASSLPNARLVFVGKPDAALASKISVSVHKERVICVDRVNTKDLTALYSAASVLLFPSLYEGFGYPVLEAQACGVPVVISNAGSLPEVAGEACLKRAPNDISGLAADVLRVLEDPDLATQLRNQGLRNVKRFGVENWRRSHHELYADTLSKKVI